MRVSVALCVRERARVCARMFSWALCCFWALAEGHKKMKGLLLIRPRLNYLWLRRFWLFSVFCLFVVRR